jgi:hypothetical protein
MLQTVENEQPGENDISKGVVCSLSAGLFVFGYFGGMAMRRERWQS